MQTTRLLIRPSEWPSIEQTKPKRKGIRQALSELRTLKVPKWVERTGLGIVLALALGVGIYWGLCLRYLIEKIIPFGL